MDSALLKCRRASSVVERRWGKGRGETEPNLKGDTILVHLRKVAFELIHREAVPHRIMDGNPATSFDAPELLAHATNLSMERMIVLGSEFLVGENHRYKRLTHLYLDICGVEPVTLVHITGAHSIANSTQQNKPPIVLNIECRPVESPPRRGEE